MKQFIIYLYIFLLNISTNVALIEGEEILVSEWTEEGWQDCSACSMNTDSIFTVVWHSAPNLIDPWGGQDGNGAGVFARQFSFDGTPLTDEFQVNTYWMNWQAYPDIATFPNGDFIIVWQSWEQDGDNYGIYGQRFTLDCTPIGEEFQINTITEGCQGFSPKVETDAEGNFIVVWASGINTETYDIYARYFNYNGVPQSDEFLVNSYTEGFQGWPSIAINNKGNFLIAWQSKYQDGTDYSIYGQLFNSDCYPIGDEFQINPPNLAIQYAPYVEALSERFIVVWSSKNQNDSWDFDVFARLYDQNCLPISEVFQVNTFTSGDHSTGICSDEEGNFTIVGYSDSIDGSDAGIFFRQLYSFWKR